VQLWDAPTGTLVNEWSWRFEWVTAVALSADGLTAVAGGRFGRVILWDLE
jgi:WD40 repeat protein